MVGTKKRIVLYNPEQHDPSRGVVASAHLLPLPLLAIAATPVRDGWEVVIVDGNVLGSKEGHARLLEACEGALLYGTTGILGYQVTDGAAATRAVKARYPDLPAVIGGWFASAAPELQLATGLYDAVAIGQGEETFAEIVAAVAAGEPLDAVAGLALWRDGGIVRTAPRGVVDLAGRAPTPWHLVDWERASAEQLAPRAPIVREAMVPPPGMRGKPFTSISYYSSFGCPLPCAFCCSPAMTGRRWKALSGETIAAELAELQERWGFHVVHFHDANMGVSEPRMRELADGILSRGLKLWHFGYFQADSIVRFQPRTLDALAESGLYMALIGAETGSDESMQQLGKTTRGDNNVLAAIEMDQRGISMMATYILGFPGEDEASMVATLEQCRRMAVECPDSAPVVWQYHPIPGAALYDKALELGFQPPRSLEEWGDFFEYRNGPTWKGAPGPRVVRLQKLYNHFAHLSNGLARGRVGWWERHARKRLEDAAGFARHWPLGTLEARAFHAWWTVEQKFRPRSHDLESGWRASTARTRHGRARASDQAADVAARSA